MFYFGLYISIGLVFLLLLMIFENKSFFAELKEFKEEEMEKGLSEKEVNGLIFLSTAISFTLLWPWALFSYIAHNL